MSWKEAFMTHMFTYREKSPIFLRDRSTWFSYILLGYYTYLQATLGPLTSIFQVRFHLSYSSASLPTSAFAVGIITTGLFGERVMRPWIELRRLWIWCGGAGMAIGAIFLTLSQNILLVVISTFLMGVFGTLLAFIVQATLADHHGEQRAIALSEANVMTSTGAILAPLLVGGLQYEGLDWRIAVFFALSLLLATAFLFRRTPITTVTTDESMIDRSVDENRRRSTRQVLNEASTRKRGHFNSSYWLYWFFLICGVAIEWSTIVWGVTLLADAGLIKSLTTITMSLFFLAEASGRFVGSRLVRSLSAPLLLMLSLVVIGLGFSLFWLAPLLTLKVVGLFLAGLGIANLFPLTLAMALSFTPGRANAASALLSLGVGLAVLIAPLVLGQLGDMLGIRQAFALVMCLLLFIAAVTLYRGDVVRKRGMIKQ